MNPFFEPWTAPFEAPPLDRIEEAHFPPAFERALAEHDAEIAAIAERADPPEFANVIEALERSGELLRRVSRVFGYFAGAESTPALQQVEREMSPRLAAHRSAILTNPDLFQRVDKVLAKADELDLTQEQRRVLEVTHRNFVRAGARLAPEARDRVSAIDQRLAELGAQFSQNVLKDESDYLMVLDSADLAGLPDSAIAAAARLAEERGHAGRYAFSLARSSVEPFLSYADRRDLRERLFAAWTRRGETGGPTDNRAVAAETLRLRAERAKLLGYKTYAHFKLDGTMAGDPEAVRGLLDEVWPAGRARALVERDRLQRLVKEEGGNFELAAHDWRYFTRKVRRADFDLDENELRAYFPLESVAQAAFDVAGKLFGLTFRRRDDLPAQHPDIRAYEVTDASGAHVALFYADYFARTTKRSGAWMSQLRGQRKLDAEVRPIVYNVMNFAKAGEGEATLLGLDEARTLFHEFGHALHGMLSSVTYPSISGTSVPTDFVELPSQLFEHWLLRPEVLRDFARHHRTGEPMPETLIEKVKAAETFNQGFQTVEYCASALVDFDLHSAPEASEDPMAAQAAELGRIGMPAEIEMRHRVPHFSHVFSGAHYASGYYSYLWSEMLDADAFRAFEETGDVFNSEVAGRLRAFILSAGDTREPKQAYLAFRGRLPDARPLLEKRGLV